MLSLIYFKRELESIDHFDQGKKQGPFIMYYQ